MSVQSSLLWLLQVFTMKQTACTITQVYPNRPSLDNFLNCFAAELGYPAADEVLATAEKGALDHQWTDFWQYAQLLDPDVSAMYHNVPFRKHKRTAEHLTMEMNKISADWLAGLTVCISQAVNACTVAQPACGMLPGTVSQRRGYGVQLCSSDIAQVCFRKSAFAQQLLSA